MKISNKASINLSLAVSVLFFLACVAGCFLAPSLVKTFIDAQDVIGGFVEITEIGKILIHATAFLILAVFIVADIFLFFLLVRVRSGLVFTDITVSLIRRVSWCCFAVCLLFAFLGIYFSLSFVVAFLGTFLGVCLRVIKNVIAEAVEIKNENDLTV